MWFTKNEKRVLSFLLDNAKTSDTIIASKLNISSQAVGKIRKHLEEDLIKKYSIQISPLNLDLKITTFFTANLIDSHKRKEAEKLILNTPNITNAYKFIGGKTNYHILSYFKTLEEASIFFESEENKINDLLEITSVKSTPSSNMIKNDETKLFQNIMC